MQIHRSLRKVNNFISNASLIIALSIAKPYQRSSLSKFGSVLLSTVCALSVIPTPYSQNLPHINTCMCCAGVTKDSSERLQGDSIGQRSCCCYRERIKRVVEDVLDGFSTQYGGFARSVLRTEVVSESSIGTKTSISLVYIVLVWEG